MDKANSGVYFLLGCYSNRNQMLVGEETLAEPKLRRSRRSQTISKQKYGIITFNRSLILLDIVKLILY